MSTIKKQYLLTKHVLILDEDKSSTDSTESMYILNCIYIMND